MAVQQGQMYAPWRRFSNSEEEQRLMVLEAREARQKQILADTRAEKARIRARAIRRMRRARGKQ